MGIVVITMKCSSVCVPMCIVLKSIRDFPQGGFRVVTGGNDPKSPLRETSDRLENKTPQNINGRTFHCYYNTLHQNTDYTEYK